MLNISYGWRNCRRGGIAMYGERYLIVTLGTGRVVSERQLFGMLFVIRGKTRSHAHAHAHARANAHAYAKADVTTGLFQPRF